MNALLSLSSHGVNAIVQAGWRNGEGRYRGVGGVNGLPSWFISPKYNPIHILLGIGGADIVGGGALDIAKIGDAVSGLIDRHCHLILDIRPLTPQIPVFSWTCRFRI